MAGQINRSHWKGISARRLVLFLSISNATAQGLSVVRFFQSSVRALQMAYSWRRLLDHEYRENNAGSANCV